MAWYNDALGSLGTGLGSAGGWLKDQFSYPSMGPQADQLRQAIAARAFGTGGPSVAQNLLRQGTQQAGQQAYSIARSTPGLSPALQARMGAMGAARAGQEAAGQAATLRSQE